MTVNTYQIAILLITVIMSGGLFFALWMVDILRIALSLGGLAIWVGLFFLAADKPESHTQPIHDEKQPESLSETSEEEAANDAYVEPKKPKRRSLAQRISRFLYGGQPTEPTLIDLSNPETEKKVLAGKLKLEPGQIVMLGNGKFGAFMDVVDGQIRVIPADSKEQAQGRYCQMIGEIERAKNLPPIEPQPEPEKPEEPALQQRQIAIKPELDETMLDGYKPEPWMLKARAKIERITGRKVEGLVTKGALPKPWTVGEAYASLNDVTVMIDTHGKNDKLLNQSFVEYLLSKLKIDGARVEKPGNGRAYPAVIFPRKKREFIMTDVALNDYYTHQVKSKTAPMVGFNNNMEVVTIDFMNSPHVLIFGESGGGKGVCIHNMIMSLIATNPPNEMQFIRLDPKNSALPLYDGVPHMIGPSLKDPLDICERISAVVDEMDRRNDMFGGQVEDLVEWNQKYPKQKLPFIIIAFDEMLDFYTSLEREENAKDQIDLVTGHLISIVNKARSSGIHMIGVTQVGSNKKLKEAVRGIKTNIAFACKKNAALQLVSDDGELQRVEYLTGKGHGLILTSGATEFQSPSTLIKDEQTHKIIKDCRKRIINAIIRKWNNAPKAELISAQSEIETEPEKELNLSRNDELYLNTIQFIAEKKKVVRDDINQQFGIGTPKTTKLLDAMADDGLISHPDGSRKPRELLPKIYQIAKKIPVKAVVKEQSTPVEGVVNVVRFDRSKTA